MNKTNNISFTSKIVVTRFPKLQEINDIEKGATEFIVPCLPDKTTMVPALRRMLNKKTRTCTSINLIFRPENSGELLVKPVHLHHNTSVRKLVPFLKNLINTTPNIESIMMWGYKNIEGKPGKKVFDKALEILSKVKEVTYFKGHSIPMDAETNALYTNKEDIMYLAPKSWTYPNATITEKNDLKYFYQDFHIAANDELAFEP